MAEMKAFKATQVAGVLRHAARLSENHSNECIDVSRTKYDYSLAPTRDMSDYDYYKQRLSQVYHQNRKDINTMFGWVIACPKSVSAERQPLFFKLTNDFLNQQFGGDNNKNCNASYCHMDETTPHLHYYAMGIVSNNISTHPEFAEKLDFEKVVTRNVLRNFHRQYADYLRAHGCNDMADGVYTGITAAQGGNKTVKQLKMETAREVEQQRQREVTVESRW